MSGASNDNKTQDELVQSSTQNLGEVLDPCKNIAQLNERLADENAKLDPVEAEIARLAKVGDYWGTLTTSCTTDPTPIRSSARNAINANKRLLSGKSAGGTNKKKQRQAKCTKTNISVASDSNTTESASGSTTTTVNQQQPAVQQPQIRDSVWRSMSSAAGCTVNLKAFENPIKVEESGPHPRLI